MSSNETPAFPVDHLATYPNEKGMSLRDYFAGQALVGMANYSSVVTAHTKRAYEYADAMMAQRDKDRK